MSVIQRTLLAATIVFATTVSAHAEMDEKVQKGAEAVDSACRADADSIGCSGEIVSEGLLGCLHAYKEAHKDFKFSRACREAMQQLRKDRKAAKS